MSNDGKNIFGGLNPHGLYVPMSEDEQEVLARLVASKNLQLVIHGWGQVDAPLLTFGDKRVAIKIRLDCLSPAVPIPVHYLDMELKLRDGRSLFRQRMPATLGGQPIQLVAGIFLDMVWDIAIDHMDPRLVKALKPGAMGLTSRRLDKDTGAATREGNMLLTPLQKSVLHTVEDDAAWSRADDVAKRITVTQQAGEEVKLTPKGPIAR